MHPFIGLLCLSAGWVLLASCAPAPASDAERIVVMTFNVENLFDTQDDPARRDETYLPLAAKDTAAHRALCADVPVAAWRNECLNWDWNDAVVATKLARLGAAVLAEGAGRGPDIVILQEVENRAIAEVLRREYLAAADYQPAILIEGQDTRGIDIAVLSRLPLAAEPALHPVTFSTYPRGPRNDTRGILEARFALPNGEPLTVFGVHFPAPYHPPAMRERSYEVLRALAEPLANKHLVIAAGDFNTTSEEIDERNTLDRLVRPFWQLAQDHGCDGCPGTYYYAPERRWNWLDTILWTGPDGALPDVASVRLANTTPAQVTAAGYPAAFRLPAATGVSDHWPVVVEFELPRP